MKLNETIQALLGQYNNNLNNLVYESTERIFYLRKMQNNELKTISNTSILVGRFYLIKYNYNDNNIFCPIFTIEYKNTGTKKILYAINLDYLPYSYKVDFFSKIFDIYKTTVDKNADINSVISESTFNGINFENVYSMLKANGDFNFAITAFDLLKIKETNVISTNIVHRFIFLNTRIVNSAMIKQTEMNTQLAEYKTKLKELIELYDNIKITNESDTKSYYKNLKSIEKNYKLYD